MKKQFQIWIMALFLIGMACCSSDNDNDLMIQPEPTPDPETPVKGEIKIVYDNFQGTSLMVIGSSGFDFMVAFDREFEGTEMNFTSVQDSLPIVMQDDQGSYWNIFGQAIDGPNKGKQLVAINSFIGYWFSWGAFYPGLEIFENSQTAPNQGEFVQGSNDWSIPRDKVQIGASKEAIPSIDNPNFTRIRTANTGDP